MRLEALETRIEEFDERNLVMQLALGLLSAGDRLEGILDRHVAADPPDVLPVLHDEDRHLIHFVLGLIGFRETIMELAQGAASGDGPLPTADPAVDFAGVLR